MPAFQKHTKSIQRALVPMADICAELGIPPDDPRELARALLVRAFGFPADTVVDDGVNEVAFTWEGAPTEAASEPKAEPKKPGKAKKPEEPAVAPPPVDVDWAAALKDGRPTPADLRKAEEDAGPEKVAAVRGKLSLGMGVTVAQIGMQSNARDYFDALRADALRADALRADALGAK